MRLTSQVIIAAQWDEVIAQLRALATQGERFEVIRAEEGKAFSVKDAKRAVEKAYLSSYERVMVILVADQFSDVVQNTLLKAIEEPPPNTEFILILSSRSTLLPTVRSRLPITVLDEGETHDTLELAMDKLDIAGVYAFVQQHKRVDNARAKVLLEQIGRAAMFSGQYRLDARTLDHLRQSRLALDKGSPAPFVLTGVLLKLLAHKKKRTAPQP